MKLKNQKKLAIFWMVFGVALWAAALIPEWDDWRFSSLLSGFAGCFFIIGLFRFIRVRRWEKTPEEAADYEAALRDERTVYVTNKARSVTFFVSVYVQLIGGLVAIFVFREKLLGQVLCYMTCFQCLLFTVLFRVYNKRY